MGGYEVFTTMIFSKHPHRGIKLKVAACIISIVGFLLLSISGAYKPLQIIVIGLLLLFSIYLGLLPSARVTKTTTINTNTISTKPKAKIDPLSF
jgi:Ca2+/Na+ antiporter